MTSRFSIIIVMVNRIVTDTEAAWIAGFLDGEGCISIRWQRSPRDRHATSSVASVSVSQAEPRTQVLYWLRSIFGGGVSSHGTEKRNPKHNKSLHWMCTGQVAVSVCRVALPHLRLKRRQAELVLEHQATKLPGHIGCRRGMSPQSVRIPPEIVALRTAQIEEIKNLNRRGVQIQ